MKTPTEMMAERVRLGLSRKELADLTGDTESFIRGIEHTKAINMPAHVLQHLRALAGIRRQMIDDWIAEQNTLENRSPCVLLTYHSDDDLKQNGSAWDKNAPTASFHRAVMATLKTYSMHGGLKTLMLCFNWQLFTASKPPRPDTFEGRRAWAIAWADQYREVS
jgi:transcriptional regulator with XRE-family HTH domain